MDSAAPTRSTARRALPDDPLVFSAARAVLRGSAMENIMESTSGNYLIAVYAAYAASSVGLTVWISRTLFKHGAVFLEQVFADEPRMADAVNRLLVVGFYLVNLGYASLLLKGGASENAVQAIEVLSSKLGLLLLSLGAMHFLNLLIFHRIRRRAKVAVLPPPVAPQMHVLANGAGRRRAVESETESVAAHAE